MAFGGAPTDPDLTALRSDAPGPTTIEIRAWDDGTWQAVASHTVSHGRRIARIGEVARTMADAIAAAARETWADVRWRDPVRPDPTVEHTHHAGCWRDHPECAVARLESVEEVRAGLAERGERCRLLERQADAIAEDFKSRRLAAKAVTYEHAADLLGKAIEGRTFQAAEPSAPTGRAG